MMMAVILFTGIVSLRAQEAVKTEPAKPEAVKLYTPEANAQEDINKAVAQAKAANKHVFVQIGGNWCPWCIKFHHFVDEDADLKKYVTENYVVVLVNTSKENYNKELLAKYEYPGRLGYPVFLILDGTGRRLNTQDSGLLEQGEGYNKSKVMTFLRQWSAAALDPKNNK